MVKRLYTPDLANRSLPLVSRIAGDLRSAAQDIRRDWQALQQKDLADPDPVREALAAARERYDELSRELDQLGVEMKDPFTGLLDFRARRGDEVVYLCWRLGEDRVDHWHTLTAGFAGRRPISEF